MQTQSSDSNNKIKLAGKRRHSPNIKEYRRQRKVETDGKVLEKNEINQMGEMQSNGKVQASNKMHQNDKNLLRDESRETEKEKKYKREEQEVINLIQQMNQAYEEDKQSMRDGKYSLSKLSLLSTVANELRKQYNHKHFIKHNGCLVLAHWLEKRSDHCFPLLDTIDCVFEVINRLPIGCAELAENVMRIYRESPCKEYQDKAKAIIEKWCDKMQDDENADEMVIKVEGLKEFRDYRIALKKAAENEKRLEDERRRTLELNRETSARSRTPNSYSGARRRTGLERALANMRRNNRAARYNRRTRQ